MAWIGKTVPEVEKISARLFNAESWMEKWGLAEEETETDEDGITTFPETDEEIPVVDDLETETEA